MLEASAALEESFYDSQWPVNKVVTDRLDPFSKQPDFKTTAVRVVKVSA